MAVLVDDEVKFAKNKVIFDFFTFQSELGCHLPFTFPRSSCALLWTFLCTARQDLPP